MHTPRPGHSTIKEVERLKKRYWFKNEDGVNEMKMRLQQEYNEKFNSVRWLEKTSIHIGLKGLITINGPYD